jgi:hypothetical protein
MKLDGAQLAAIAWLETEEGTQWSRAAHQAAAGDRGRSHRIGALMGSLEPPEHEPDICQACCQDAGAVSFDWIAEPASDLYVGTGEARWKYEPGLVDWRLGPPA